MFALVIPLLVVNSLDDGAVPAPPSRSEGTTDRIAFFSVRPGQSEAQVRGLIRGAPREIERVERPGGPADCWIYDRRSGAPGEFRFCFRSGFLVSKSRTTR